jgi:hypothetical protein
LVTPAKPPLKTNSWQGPARKVVEVALPKTNCRPPLDTVTLLALPLATMYCSAPLPKVVLLAEAPLNTNWLAPSPIVAPTAVP